MNYQHNESRNAASEGRCRGACSVGAACERVSPSSAVVPLIKICYFCDLPPVNGRQVTSPASVDVQLARETWHARVLACDVDVRQEIVRRLCLAILHGSTRVEKGMGKSRHVVCSYNCCHDNVHVIARVNYTGL